MISKVLLPVDGSERSIKAAKKGIEIAHKFNAEIYGIYVVPSQSMLIDKIVFGDTTKLPEELKRITMEERENGKNILNMIENIVSEKFPRGTFRKQILEGDPKKEIINVAERNNIDLIVMASSKIHNRFLIGSVTEHVIRNSPCAVMIVK